MNDDVSRNLLVLAIDIFNSVGDASSFQKHLMIFDKVYKKASYLEQGEYHHLWCEWLKGSRK